MKNLRKISVENTYSGSDWDFEKTTKYIFEIKNKEVEAGYFEHYKNGVLVKTVLELPQSYGCPTKCRFCASAAIEQFEAFDTTTLETIFVYLYEDNHLEEQKYVLLTMTGTGDIFFNYDNVEQFLLKLQKYKNLHVTLSSCLWNVELIKKVENLRRYIKIRNIQITYVTDDKAKLERIIPFYQKNDYYFKQLIEYIQESKTEYYRINYVMIKGVNDSAEEFYNFRNNIEKIKDKVVVRISKLNETGATRRNQLESTDIAVLEEFQRILQEENIKSYVFYAYKNDNMNCGQLITEK